MTGSSKGSNACDEERSPEEHPFPERGRLMGLDFGTKRLGVAVSNAEQTIASPLENYNRAGDEADARHLGRLVDDYAVAGIVVGLPVHISGEEGAKARQARRFGQWVGEVTGRPVRFWDERYTSAQADEHLLGVDMTRKKRKARLDKLAAQIILQSYLDAADRGQPPQPM